MNEKAQEMIKVLEASGKNYSIWDMICLSCVTLVNTAETTPQIKPSVKIIVGLFLDSEIEASKGVIRD